MDAALSCMCRWGISKTTLDDVAREAGLSRATVYRAVPGGKNELVRAVVDREVSLAVARLDSALARADSIDELLVAGLVGAARQMADHDLLQFLLAHDPEALLPFVAFDRLDPALVRVQALAGPHLRRFLPERTARETAEWITRLLLSFTLVPGSVDLTDPDAVRAYLGAVVLPGIELAAADERGRIDRPTTTRPTTTDPNPGGTR